LIKVKDVWKSYDAVSVLRGLSIEIPSQQITIILGKSGVGKSVLLRIISGLETPDRGEIEIDNVVHSTLSESQLRTHTKTVGMLFQSSALFDSMTVEENVGFALQNVHNTNQDKQEVCELVDKTLEQVGMSGFQKKYPSELSGGQKRRTALARLIVYRPKILLFDEPTTGLDPITARQIATLIKTTQQELRSTVIVVTHDIVSALEIGEYFALHSEGTITVSGNKKDFFKNKDPLLLEFLSSSCVQEVI
jgi:phospholipid/cholesterol/gamma-HCH transport system ATP-binding protein